MQILFFIADPTTIQSGQSSTLTWRTEDADSATISPNIGGVSAQGGSISVAPTSTTTYTLTAKNARRFYNLGGYGSRSAGQAADPGMHGGTHEHLSGRIRRGCTTTRSTPPA